MIDSNDALSIAGRPIAGSPSPGSDLIYDGSRFRFGCRSGEMTHYTDDLIGGLDTSGNIGQWGWNVFSSAGTPVVTPDGGASALPAGTLGLVMLGTGATSGNDATLTPGNAYANIRIPTGSNEVDIVFRAGIGNYVSSTGVANADFHVGLGFLLGASFTLARGVYFEKLAADTNWWGVTDELFTRTKTDTGVVAAVETMTAFRIKWTPTSARFWVASSIAGLASATPITNTTNLPTTNLSIVVQVKTNTAASRHIYLDLVDLAVKMSR